MAQVESMTLSVVEAARMLGIGHSLAYELIAREEFPTRLIRVGKRWRVVRADLERFIAGPALPPQTDMPAECGSVV